MNKQLLSRITDDHFFIMMPQRQFKLPLEVVRASLRISGKGGVVVYAPMGKIMAEAQFTPDGVTVIDFTDEAGEFPCYGLTQNGLIRLAGLVELSTEEALAIINNDDCAFVLSLEGGE